MLSASRATWPSVLPVGGALLGTAAAAPARSMAGGMGQGGRCAERRGSTWRRLFSNAPSPSTRGSTGPITRGWLPRSASWPRSTRPPAVMPRLSCFSNAPSPSTRRRSAPSTPTSPAGSTTWPCSTGLPIAPRGRVALCARHHDPREKPAAGPSGPGGGPQELRQSPRSARPPRGSLCGPRVREPAIFCQEQNILIAFAQERDS